MAKLVSTLVDISFGQAAHVTLLYCIYESITEHVIMYKGHYWAFSPM